MTISKPVRSLSKGCRTALARDLPGSSYPPDSSRALRRSSVGLCRWRYVRISPNNEQSPQGTVVWLLTRPAGWNAFRTQSAALFFSLQHPRSPRISGEFLLFSRTRTFTRTRSMSKTLRLLTPETTSSYQFLTRTGYRCRRPQA